MASAPKGHVLLTLYTDYLVPFGSTTFAKNDVDPEVA